MAPRSAPERKTLELVNRTWKDYGRGLDIPVGGLTLWKIRERNARRYLGDHHDKMPRRGMQQAVINRIGNSIITTVAVQTEQPWRLRLTPHETDDDPVYFLTNSGIRKIQLAQQEGSINLERFLVDNITNDKPLDAAHGEAFEALTKPQIDPNTGEVGPSILEEGSDLIKITDAKCAEQLQTICSSMMDRAQVDYYTTAVEMMANITGDQMVIFEWDSDLQRPKLTVPNWTNYRFDPRGTWIDDCRGVILEQHILARDAIEEYPDFEEDIIAGVNKAHGQHPELMTMSSDGRKEGGAPNFVKSSKGDGNTEMFSEDAMVTIRTMWRRGHLFPIREDKPELEEGIDHLDTAKGESVRELEETNQGDEVRFDRGIRQVTVLVEAERVVEDVKCPYSDIPCPWTKNITIPYSPYGMGEPFRQEDIQLLINRVTTMILNTLRYHAYPMEVMPNSLKAAFTQDGSDWSAHPGRITWLEDDQFEDWVLRGGLKGFSIDPQTIPPSWVQILQVLLNEQQRLAGDTDVIQGQLPSPDTSGVALEALQQGGSRVMALKARSLEWTFEWISRLLVDSVINWLDDEEWDKYSMKYAGAVRHAMRSRTKNLEYDVRVEAVAGRAANDRLDAQKAMNAVQLGLISKETALEMLNIPDPKGELMRSREELLADAAAAQGAQSPEEQQGLPSPQGGLTPPGGGTIPSAPTSTMPRNGQGRF